MSTAIGIYASSKMDAPKIADINSKGKARTKVSLGI